MSSPTQTSEIDFLALFMKSAQLEKAHQEVEKNLGNERKRAEHIRAVGIQAQDRERVFE